MTTVTRKMDTARKAPSRTFRAGRGARFCIRSKAGLAPLTEQEKAANDAIYSDLSERTIAAAPAELIQDCAWWGGAMNTRGFVARLMAVCAYPGGRWTNDHFPFNADPEFPGYRDNPVSAEQAAFALTFCQELHQTPGIDEARLHHEDGACKFD